MYVVVVVNLIRQEEIFSLWFFSEKKKYKKISFRNHKKVVNFFFNFFVPKKSKNSVKWKSERRKSLILTSLLTGFCIVNFVSLKFKVWRFNQGIFLERESFLGMMSLKCLILESTISNSVFFCFVLFLSVLNLKRPQMNNWIYEPKDSKEILTLQSIFLHL